jgi:DNA recombination protein RmuC
MEGAILILLVLLLLGVAVTVIVLLRQSRMPADPGLTLMQQQIDALRAQLQESLGQQSQSVQQQLGQLTGQVNHQLSAMVQQLHTTAGQIGSRLDHASKVVGEVRQNLGELSKTTQQVYDVGKDIASLHEILRAPKLRGVLGELFLGDLLGQMLPAGQFTLQHRFASGEIVDAVVRLGQSLVPIDSKFPLENFRRLVEAQTDDERKSARRKFVTDVKKHIDAVEKKYILPDEGTYPFALLYIPAENVYYETIIKDELNPDDAGLSAYALERKVIPVSPNSLYAYLQAIVLGLKGLQIEKNARTIIVQLDAMKGDVRKFRLLFDTMGTHLTNAANKYQEASRQLVHLSDRLELAGGEELQEPAAPPAIARAVAKGTAPEPPEQQLRLP